MGDLAVEDAHRLLESVNYRVQSISRIREGLGHFVFDVSLSGGEKIIAKFENNSRLSKDGVRKDFSFNSELSLEREGYTADLLRKAGLPSPLSLIHQAEGKRFIVQQKIPGKVWCEYVKENDFKITPFLKSLEHLGADEAETQRLKFSSYGNITPEGIKPKGITSFEKRLQQILKFKLVRAEEKKALTKKELKSIQNYFWSSVNSLILPTDVLFIFSDLHPNNFLVDRDGKPSGYFDLEHCQAGPPVLDVYHHKLHLFNYFDENTFEKALEAYFRGYHNNGGNYEFNDPTNKNLENVLSAGFMMGCITAYHQVRDGLRDDWSDKFKELLFQSLSNKNIPYDSIADIFRQKTKQPKYPNP